MQHHKQFQKSYGYWRQLEGGNATQIKTHLGLLNSINQERNITAKINEGRHQNKRPSNQHDSGRGYEKRTRSYQQNKHFAEDPTKRCKDIEKKGGVMSKTN